MTKNDLKLFVADVFFPNRCPLCGEVIAWDLKFCPECVDSLPMVGDEICRTCGLNTQSCTCGNYAVKNNYDYVFPAFYYKDTAKKAVVYLKSYVSDIFPTIVANKIKDDFSKYNLGIKFDYIVPVPMTKGKQRSRGHNQAEIYAKGLSEVLGVPINNELIKKNFTIIAQHNLSSDFRKINADKLYSVKGDINLEGLNIILCDDVMTTGSTVNKCAKLLKSLGAKNVVIAVACTTELLYF